MSGQKQIHKESAKSDTKTVEKETAPTEAKDLHNQKLEDDIDAILDEIDEVLEENAQEFVAAFIQKGGE